jgi:uncharacterized protein (DUF885 family)
VVNDPKDYSTVEMVTLFLHEGVPGHHLHAALLKEMNLPDYRKFNTENLDTAAYTEGWALYCETLGKEFGFYDQPDAYFGHLNNELLRAVRLVVDTGMHAQGWSRERAIAYTVDTLGYSEAKARNQIERYMATPGSSAGVQSGCIENPGAARACPTGARYAVHLCALSRRRHWRRNTAAADTGSPRQCLDCQREAG